MIAAGSAAAAALWKRGSAPAAISSAPDPAAAAPVAQEPIEPPASEPAPTPSKPDPKPAAKAPVATKSVPPELEAEDLAVLEVLAQEGRLPEARTAWAVAISLERRPDQVNSILTRLARRGAAESSVVRVGGEVWAVTAAGTEQLGSSE